jgi:hypothetical protein
MRKFLVGLLVSVAAVVVIGSSAGAGPPAIATGTWDCRNAAFSVESSRTAGGNTILLFSAVGCVFAGDVTGTFSAYNTEIVRSDGSAAVHGMIVCTGCTFGGRTGDFTSVQLWQRTSTSPLEAKGTVTVLSATGGLTGLHFQEHFVFTGTAFGTYSFRYSFEP